MRPMLARLLRDDVRVEISGGTDLAPIAVDRGQLEQVILNLAVNAQDAMPSGGTLTIGAANVDSGTDGRFVVITVTDSGIGMTEQVRQQLFEPFFTTKEPGKGTGLGLATVHGIVAQSGGSVRVFSELGHGSRFEVWFPKAESADVVNEPSTAPGASFAGHELLLVVDDAEGLRNLTSRLLTRLGYTVLAAGNAAEAIRLFYENPAIALILTDVVMPGMSGPALVRELVERRPVKVIYMSGYTMSGYTDEAIVQHGVLQPGIAFVHKPYTADGLGRKLREVLDTVEPVAAYC
jgi:two-component system cell cycle sensor histidine kinase/response regulator CckA